MSADMMREFTFAVVAAEDVRAGDLYANGATVTSVVLGPTHQPDVWHDPITANECVIRCGESFATKGQRDRGVVVGRKF